MLLPHDEGFCLFVVGEAVQHPRSPTARLVLGHSPRAGRTARLVLLVRAPGRLGRRCGERLAQEREELSTLGGGQAAENLVFDV